MRGHSLRQGLPDQALDHGLTDINKAKMGIAVLIDHETCLNFLGLRCDVCYRVCPVIDKAITLDMQPNQRTGRHAMFLPTVHSEHCTGCGKCENPACWKIGHPRPAAKLEKGRWASITGWAGEQKKAGGSLIDESKCSTCPTVCRKALFCPDTTTRHPAIPKRCAAWPAARPVSSRACRLAWEASHEPDRNQKRIGAEAVEKKGWLGAHKWLILRRISQLPSWGLFLLGPLAGIWIVKGNLNYSYTLGVLPLTDPYVALQSLVAGHVPENSG